MAGYQAQYAVLNAIFRPWKGFKIPYSAVPWVTFTSPEIARVGWNEQELQEKKIPYQKITVSLQENDRAVMEGERGFLNVLLRPGSGKVLGVTAVGENAGEWFVEWPFLIRNNLKMKHVLNTIHAYPTVGEINRRAAAKWRGESTPEWIKNILKSLQNWQRR
jgi:pyruvate/2-oxoglutarate dehydrogenase complex dihydrolipoamide dehydrogenase (E3) component